MAEFVFFRPIFGSLGTPFYKLLSKFDKAAPAIQGFPTYPDDEVFPVHYFDDTEMNRKMIMNWTLRFDDVLDADKLHTSLASLLERADWRKLGGRLRLNKNGKLEVHVPRQFTPQRPAVRYSHVVEEISINEHSLASQLPIASNTPNIHPGPVFFRWLGIEFGSPRSLHDYLNTDEPQISLHIVSFLDATLVSLSWPHTMTDAMGRRALVDAWSQVLAGREASVPPLLGTLDDPMARIGINDPSESPKSPHVLSDQQIKGFSLPWFLTRSLVHLVWEPPQQVLHTISLPKAAVDRLVEEARAGINTNYLGTEKPFISEGDVLVAWLTRMGLSNLSPRTERSVVVANAFDIRGRLGFAFESGGSYIQNLVFTTLSIVPAAEILQEPLGHIAQQLRWNLSEQTTEAQIQAQARLLRESYAKTGHGPAFGDSSSIFFMFSNWTKAKFFDAIDFSPAIVKEGCRSNDIAKGKPVYYHSQTLEEGPTPANIVNILGRDPLGNYWITAYFPEEAWWTVEEELDRLSKF